MFNLVNNNQLQHQNIWGSLSLVFLFCLTFLIMVDWIPIMICISIFCHIFKPSRVVPNLVQSENQSVQFLFSRIQMEVGKEFIFVFPSGSDPILTANNVLIFFVFICSFTTIQCPKFYFFAVSLLLSPKVNVTLHPQQPLAQQHILGLFKFQDSYRVTFPPNIPLTVSKQCAIEVLWPCFLLCYSPQWFSSY